MTFGEGHNHPPAAEPAVRRGSAAELVLAATARAEDIDALLTTIADLRKHLSRARCAICNSQIGAIECSITADEELAHRTCIVVDAAEGL